MQGLLDCPVKPGNDKFAVLLEDAHMGYARSSSGCRAIGYQMTAAPYVLLDDSLTPGGRSLLYTEPELIVAAHAPGEVDAALDRISAGLARGLHAAGYFAYELGYCLEPKLRGLLPDDRSVPLLWIGLFDNPRPLDDEGTRAWLEANGAAERAKISDLKLSWSRERYDRAFAKVADYIAAGDVYQINLTMKYRFAFEGDAVALYAALGASSAWPTAR